MLFINLLILPIYCIVILVQQNSFRDFPIHKPVIIQLDHHSSEDDDAIKNDSLKSSYAYVDRKPASQVIKLFFIGNFW